MLLSWDQSGCVDVSISEWYFVFLKSRECILRVTSSFPVYFPSGFVWTARSGFIVCVRAPRGLIVLGFVFIIVRIGALFFTFVRHDEEYDDDIKIWSYRKNVEGIRKESSLNSQCSGVPRLEKHRRVDKGQLNKIGRNDHTRFPHIACVYSYFLGSFSVANQSASWIPAPSIAFSTTTQRLQDWPQRFHIHCRLFPFSL